MTTRSNRIITSETDMIPICHQTNLITEKFWGQRDVHDLEQRSDTYHYQRTFRERCLLQNEILKVFFFYNLKEYQNMDRMLLSLYARKEVAKN